MGDAARDTEPPLEPFDEDESEDEEPRDDFGELLPALEEEELDTEDEGVPATKEDFSIDTPLDDDTLDDQTSPDLKFGPDSVLPEEDDGGAGDAAGLDVEPHPHDAEPEDALPADAEERDGIDDSHPLVDDRDLPGLDADADGTEDDAARFGTFVVPHETSWPHAAVPWRVTTLSPERCSALGLAPRGATAVAGSTDLLWVEPGRSAPVRLALDGTRILTLVLLGAEQDTVLAVTAVGRLLRRARLASDSERLGELGRAEELGGPASRVTLAAVGAGGPRSLVACVTPGRLLRSGDAGASLEAVEPELRLRALSSTATPLVALSSDGRELALSNDGANTFERRRLDGFARTVAEGEAPLVAGHEGTLTIADFERGLALSTDGGATFREVPGCVEVTACTIGRHQDRSCVWLSLYSEATDTTRVLLIDAERADAQVIASISGPGDDQDAQVAPSARLAQLGWDGQRLFAVGEPGFLELEPPGAEARR